jgi:seryl-tRNA synthetase
MCIVCLALGGGAGWFGAQKSADRKVSSIQKVLDQAKIDAKDASDKIKADSKDEADKNAIQLTELQVKLTKTTKGYEETLKANKRLRYEKVPVPGFPGTTVDVGFEGDKQVCRSYPSTYVDQINDMVKKTEESLK